MSLKFSNKAWPVQPYIGQSLKKGGGGSNLSTTLLNDHCFHDAAAIKHFKEHW